MARHAAAHAAWSKVRKARWFARHTRLMGDAFDDHGRPGPILLGRLPGRLLVLPLLLAYGYALLWSTTAGPLHAAGPCASALTHPRGAEGHAQPGVAV